MVIRISVIVLKNISNKQAEMHLNYCHLFPFDSYHHLLFCGYY